MGELTPSDLAKAWIEFIRRLNPATGDIDDHSYAQLSDNTDWPVDRLIEYSIADPARAYDVILCIAAMSDDEWVLSSVAAGPLETIVRSNPREFVPRLADDATRNPNIRVIVRNMWFDSLPEEMKRELDHIRGQQQS
jgi:hypothetical protein